MRLLVKHRLRRTRREGYVERSETIEADEIRIGRGSDTELHLPDGRVLLHHATLAFENGELTLRADASAEIELDGIPVDIAQLTPGRTVAVGPYDITCGEPVEGHDAAIGVELARPMGDAETIVRERVRTPLLSRRRSGWALGALVALVLLVIGVGIPLGSFFGEREPQRVASENVDRDIIRMAENLWVTEGLSNVHHNLDAGCQACHVTPFAAVAETTCLDCHNDQTAHVGPHATFSANIDLEAGCQACHREHEGPKSMLPGTEITETGCVACHNGDIETGDGLQLAKVASIADHPPVTLPTPPASGLIFSHASHLVEQGKRGPTGERQKLGCADCHQTENASDEISIPTFESGCRSCHTLAFAAEDPARRLPHGSVPKVRDAVFSFYEALEAGEIEVPVIAAPERRRRPGRSDTPDEVVELPEIVPAAVRAERAMSGPPVKGQCATCHALNDGASAAEWTVAPVGFVTDWITGAHFSHADHVDEASCTSCHAVAKSEKVSDVAMPTMGGCLECHGSASDFPEVESTCVTCHEYHGTAGAGASLPDDETHRFASVPTAPTSGDNAQADVLKAILAEARN